MQERRSGVIVNVASEAGRGGAFGGAVYAAAKAMRRMGHPDEVAAAVAYLASDDASYITGTRWRRRLHVVDRRR